VRWRYWALKLRAPGKYVFAPESNGGTLREEVHPYLDPTNTDPNKPSDMLMVWNLGAERAQAVVGGEYTLGQEQLADLQEWCVLQCPYVSNTAMLTFLLSLAAARGGSAAQGGGRGGAAGARRAEGEAGARAAAAGGGAGGAEEQAQQRGGGGRQGRRQRTMP